MAAHIVIDSNDGFVGVDDPGESDVESPGSGGASPYLHPIEV
jgi:hypothetical protein